MVKVIIQCSILITGHSVYKHYLMNKCSSTVILQKQPTVKMIVLNEWLSNFCMHSNFSCFRCRLLTFFSKLTFSKNLSGTLFSAKRFEYIHIIIIVTSSGVLYHVEWMRSYHQKKNKNISYDSMVWPHP